MVTPLELKPADDATLTPQSSRPQPGAVAKFKPKKDDVSLLLKTEEDMARERKERARKEREDSSRAQLERETLSSHWQNGGNAYTTI